MPKSPFISLHAELHRIRRLQRNAALDCYRFQLRVLAIIRAAEQIVRGRKSLVSAEQLALTRASCRLSKAEAREVKRRIQRHHDAIARARWRINVARSLANGLVFLFLPKWDLKPLASKESSGFISGKEGLRLELRVLRDVALKMGQIAFLNDLTDCLRYGDVTVASSPPCFIEVKSGRADTARDRRQHTNAEEIVRYLREDVADNWKGTGFRMVRKPLLLSDRYHRRVLVGLIQRAHRFGFDARRVEAGLYYITLGKASVDEAVARLRKHLCEPMVFPLFGEFPPHYTPLSLSITDTAAWWSVVRGEVSLLVIIDKASVIQTFATAGVVAEWVDIDDVVGPGWSLHLPQMPDVSPFRVSGQFFGRVAGEFLSLRWFIDEAVARIRRIAEVGLDDLPARD